MPAADPYPVLCLLQSYLEARADRGEKRLWLTVEAREALREMVRMRPRPWSPEKLAALSAAAEAGREESAGATEPEKPEAEADLPDDQDGTDQKEGTNGKVVPDGGAKAQAGPMMAEDPVSPPAVSLPSGPLTLAEKEARLAVVRAKAEEGHAARALGTLRDRMVFATGSAAAEIVFVGEAPGAEEERQGEPFVGPAGQLLTRILKVMGLERGDVYISNICKYRPAMESQGSRNRQPTVAEMASCLDFVREEIGIIRPRVIVALGATAMTGLLGIKTGVMSARGKFYEFEGIPVMVTLHPSYLLRREQDGPEAANAEKRKVWEDMLQVMERAGMPVSDKQRRFFLPR
ncbi:MAG: uracil-DNA glycosylase [Verrucomicrobiota bacterium]